MNTTATQTDKADQADDFNQKTIAQFLDRSAARAERVNAIPATGKQCWFLAGLIARHRDGATYSEIVTSSTLVLTKRRASSMIDGYLN